MLRKIYFYIVKIYYHKYTKYFIFCKYILAIFYIYIYSGFFLPYRIFCGKYTTLKAHIKAQKAGSGQDTHGFAVTGDRALSVQQVIDPPARPGLIRLRIDPEERLPRAPVEKYNPT